MPSVEVASALGEIQLLADRIAESAALIEQELPAIKEDPDAWRLALGFVHHAQRTVYDQERAMLRMAMALSKASRPHTI